MKKFVWIFMAICFLAALGIRVYDLKDLPLDFHPTRQLQSMIKARGMYDQGLVNLPDWQRRFAVLQWKAMPTEEPEIVEHLAVWSYQLVKSEALWIPRLYSILFWLIGGLALFDLACEMTGISGAVIATLFYLFLPYGIVASRTFMPDPLMVMAILLGLWAAWRWSKQRSWGWAIAAGVLCGLAIYVKLTAIFIIAGGLAGLALGEWGWRQAIRSAQVWVVALISLLPALIYNFVGIFAMKFIDSGAVALRIQPSMLFQPLTYLEINNQLNRVMGAVVVLAAVAGGWLLTSKRARALMIGLWGGYLVFGVVFIYYYATHDYYHLPLIPIAALGLAPIGQALVDKLQSAWPRRWLPVLVAILLLLAVGESLLETRDTLKHTDYSQEPAFWQMLGDKLHNDRVIALTEDYNGRLAYFGWLGADYWLSSGDFAKRAINGINPNVEKLFDQQTAGKDVFLITMMPDLDAQPQLKQILYDRYPILMQGDRYIVFDLKHPK